MAAAQQQLLDMPEAKPVKRTPRARKPKPQVGFNAAVTYRSGQDSAGRRMWVLEFPAPARMISVNGNPHWRVTSPARKAWREAVFVHAKAAKLPVGLARVSIWVELRFPTGGRRDAANYHGNVVKPCVDALGPAINTVRGGKPLIAPGHGLIPDDTAEYLDGPFVRLGPSGKTPGAPFGQVILTITDLGGVP